MTTSAEAIVQISNSEAAAWLGCQRRWYYAHSLNIKPKQYGEALNRGIIGHEALAAYYDNNFNTDAGRAVIMEHYTISDGEEKKMLYKLLSLLDRYYMVDPFKTWKIVAVEQQYDIPLTVRFGYSMRLDLLAKNPVDSKTYLIDHKFVYDFWQSLAFELNAQFPKYLTALQQNDVKVDGVIVNMLRHRVDPLTKPDVDLFKMQKIFPDSKEKKRIFREHLQVSDTIADMREKPQDEQSELVLRNLSQTTCKTCPYTDLCKAELVGQDPSLMIKTFYESNDYGYSPIEDAV